MSSTEHAGNTGTISLTAVRATVAAMPNGRDREVAQLRLDWLTHIRHCQAAMEQSILCNSLSVVHSGNGASTEPERPYLTWECCDTHRALGVERERLERDAQRLNVDVRRHDLPYGGDTHHLPDGTTVLFVDILMAIDD